MCVPRRGLSLIELLVVVGLVAVLAGLLLSAVQKVREAANAAHCRNNLKQLGLAVLNYESARGKLPPAFALALTKGVPPLIGHAWGPYLLPYVERDDLARGYDFTTTFAAGPNEQVITTPLAVVVCPSAPRRDVYTCVDRTRIGTASAPLICSAAPADYAPLRGVNPSVYDPGGLNIPAGDPRHPADTFGMLRPDFPPFQRPKRSADVPDGLSHTILIAEAAGRPDLWLAGRRQAAHDVHGTPPVVSGGWGDLLGIENFFVTNSTPDGLTDGAGSCLVNCRNDSALYAFHPSGANAVFGDGSVRLVSSAADPYAVAAAGTAGGRETVGDF